jgi:hypothetical protein
MARLATLMTDAGGEHATPFVLEPSRIGEALRLAIVQADNDVGAVQCRDDEIAGAIEQIRHASAFRQYAEGRIRDLESALEAAREDARRDMRTANHRAEQAAARAEAEAERAASAEHRVQIVEDRLDQVMSVIESELKPRTAQL